MRPFRRVAAQLLLATATLASQPWPAGAQAEPTVPVHGPTTLRWWHGVVALGGVSAFMLLDHPAQRFFQHNESASSDDVAGGLRHFGQVEVFGTVTVGLVAAGLASGNEELTRAGGRL